MTCSTKHKIGNRERTDSVGTTSFAQAFCIYWSMSCYCCPRGHDIQTASKCRRAYRGMSDRNATRQLSHKITNRGQPRNLGKG